jgi:hypothetical protein
MMVILEKPVAFVVKIAKISLARQRRRVVQRAPHAARNRNEGGSGRKSSTEGQTTVAGRRWRHAADDLVGDGGGVHGLRHAADPRNGGGVGWRWGWRPRAVELLAWSDPWPPWSVL